MKTKNNNILFLYIGKDKKKKPTIIGRKVRDETLKANKQTKKNKKIIILNCVIRCIIWLG